MNRINGLIFARKGRVYDASLGKGASVFADDPNMSAKEKYGVQSPIELPHEWIGRGFSGLTGAININ